MRVMARRIRVLDARLYGVPGPDDALVATPPPAYTPEPPAAGG
jgi:hypothetical protein